MKKAIILAIILIAIGGAALYFKNYKVPDNQAQSSSTPPVTKYDETTIPKVINDFYQNYEVCLKNPPASAAGRVSEYCQSNTGLTTTTFAANLVKGGIAEKGADPIFCAQSVPESKKVSSDFWVKNDKATGFMDEKFGPNQIKVQIEFVSEKGVWKVDNVICPLPSPAVWEIIREKLAEKYHKSLSEVQVTVAKSDDKFAAGSVLFGTGGPGEGGLFLAVKNGNDW